jgi:SAM-dependent methyltransferase
MLTIALLAGFKLATSHDLYQYARREGACRDAAFSVLTRVDARARAATSIDDCKRACSADRACASFGWDAGGRTTFEGVTSQCWLSAGECVAPDCCHGSFNTYSKAAAGAPHMHAREFDAVLGNASAYHRSHYRRYLHTVRAWETYGKLRRGLRVLDVGAMGGLMQRLFNVYGLGITVDALRGDIRYPWKGLPQPRYDLVLCLETLEHLKDRPIAGLSELDATIAFHYIGVFNFFVEARNVLRDDGVLISTTPNANGYLSLSNTLHQRPPAFFELHVHEYTAHELRALHEGAGLRVLLSDTRDAFAIPTFRSKPLIKHLDAFLREHKLETHGRGDDLLFVATTAAGGAPPQSEFAIRSRGREAGKGRESVLVVACRDDKPAARGEAPTRMLSACNRSWTLAQAVATFGGARGARLQPGADADVGAESVR